MNSRVFSVVGMNLVIAMLVGTRAGAAEELTLVKGGASEYVIVLCKDASAAERWAAEDLASHLKQMSGAMLKIETEGDAVPETAIVLGAGPASMAAGIKSDTAQLGTEGYVMKTVGSKLFIVGGRQRGTMYGVYDLLGRLGCRWWAPGASTVPQLKTISLPVLDVTRVPVLEYRAVLYGDSREPDYRLWAARNHINGLYFDDLIPDQFGGSFRFDSLAHTFSRLVPPATYMKDHPEFYALKSGKRTAAQLCLSNADLVPVVAAALNKLADEHPEYAHVTFGQDDNGSFCECPGCKALYEKFGEHSGAMVDFTNKVAALVKEKHPKMWVNTMAYEWSRQPPRGISPADNVMITFCSIECDFGRPLVEPFGPINPGFVQDAEGWAKLARKVFVWDYTTNFVGYLLPYPNYYSIQPNIKFFADHKVTGLFEQGSHTTNNGQFSKLCQWVAAQAMWNPEADGKKLVEEFMLGYYGPQAGPLVLEYANLLHDKVIRDKIPVYATHRTFASAAYLSPDVIARGEELFQKAELAVQGDAELLRRVQVAHLPVQLMILRRPMDMFAPAKKLCPDLAWPKLCEQFVRVAEAAQVTALAEGDSAKPFYEWTTDYGKAMAKGDGSELPAEVRALPAGTYRYWHAAQLDQQTRFLKKREGATLGWAQNIITYGWAIQHNLSNVWDYAPGKSYKFFVRYRGQAKPEAAGAAGAGVQFGIHVKDGPRASVAIPLANLDGQWHVAEIGSWTKAPVRDPAGRGGPAFFACLDQKNEKLVSDVCFDSFWLVEAAPATAPAK